MKLTVQLKECPLCASFRVVVEDRRNRVLCMNCGCNTGTKETVSQAVVAWNERKTVND